MFTHDGSDCLTLTMLEHLHPARLRPMKWRALMQQVAATDFTFAVPQRWEGQGSNGQGSKVPTSDIYTVWKLSASNAPCVSSSFGRSCSSTSFSLEKQLKAACEPCLGADVTPSSSAHGGLRATHTTPELIDHWRPCPAKRASSSWNGVVGPRRLRS